jgi:hypothetical protein
MKRAKTKAESRAESREQWRGIVAEFEKSGQTAREFCAGRGIAESAFGYWRRRESRTQALRFVPVVRVGQAQTPGAHGGGVVLEVGGSRIRVESGFDRALLLDVVRTLEGGAR